MITHNKTTGCFTPCHSRTGLPTISLPCTIMTCFGPVTNLLGNKNLPQVVQVVDTPGLGFNSKIDMFYILDTISTLNVSQAKINVIIWVMEGQALRHKAMHDLVIDVIDRAFINNPFQRLLIAIPKTYTPSIEQQTYVATRLKEAESFISSNVLRKKGIKINSEMYEGVIV